MRTTDGRFKDSGKPTATITLDANGYTLHLGDRSIGGLRSALMRYARANGYKVRVSVERQKSPKTSFWNIVAGDKPW